MDAHMEDAGHQLAVDDGRRFDLPTDMWQKIMRLLASVHGPSSFALATTSRFFYERIFKDDIEEVNKVLNLSHLYEQVPGLRGFMLGYLTAITLHPITNIYASIMIGTRKIWYTQYERTDGVRLLNATKVRDHPQAIYNLNVSTFIFGINPDVGTPHIDMSSFVSGGPHRQFLTQCRTNLRKKLSVYVVDAAPEIQPLCDLEDLNVVHNMGMVDGEEVQVTCPMCIVDTEASCIRNRYH